MENLVMHFSVRFAQYSNIYISAISQPIYSRRLCQFEREFLSALTRRHTSLPSASAQLDIVSFAIHLQGEWRTCKGY